MKTYTSEDQGGYSIVFMVVFDYATDRHNFLFMADDHADGLTHIYYGPSLTEGLETVRNTDESLVHEIVNHIKIYAPNILQNNI
jgi:hypothetical protein